MVSRIAARLLFGGAPVVGSDGRHDAGLGCGTPTHGWPWYHLLAGLSLSAGLYLATCKRILRLPLFADVVCRRLCAMALVAQAPQRVAVLRVLQSGPNPRRCGCCLVACLSDPVPRRHPLDPLSQICPTRLSWLSCARLVWWGIPQAVSRVALPHRLPPPLRVCRCTACCLLLAFVRLFYRLAFFSLCATPFAGGHVASSRVRFFYLWAPCGVVILRPVPERLLPLLLTARPGVRVLVCISSLPSRFFFFP